MFDYTILNYNKSISKILGLHILILFDSLHSSVFCNSCSLFKMVAETITETITPNITENIMKTLLKTFANDI